LRFSDSNALKARKGNGRNMRKCTTLSIGIPKKFISMDGIPSGLAKQR
jgi:hypothetical protein